MPKEENRVCPGISIDNLIELKPMWAGEIEGSDESKEIGLVIRDLRTNHSISRSELASTFNVQVEHLVLVENGLVSKTEAQDFLDMLKERIRLNQVSNIDFD